MARLLHEFRPGDVTQSAERTITGADVSAFAALTGDRNALHADGAPASGGPFGRPIAHGALVFSVSLGLLQDDAERAPHVVAFLGADRLRFSRPVFPGDSIRVRHTVRSVDAVTAETGMLETAVEVVNQDGAVAVTYTAKLLVRRSPAVGNESAADA